MNTSNPIELSNHLKDTTKARKFKATSKHGTSFMKAVVPELTKAIDAIRVRPTKGRPPVYIDALEGLESNTIALLILGVCLDNLIDPINRLTLALRVSQYILQEHNYGTLEANNPSLLKGIQGKYHTHVKRRIINGCIANGQFGEEAKAADVWTEDKHHTIGLTLLSVVEQMGLIVVQAGTNERTKKYSWSTEVLQWADATYQGQLFYSPAYLPLTSIPAPYNEGINDSYGESFPPVTFRLRDSWSRASSPTPLDNGNNVHAANYLSTVGYRLNTEVFSIVEELWMRGYEVGQLVSSMPEDIPPLIPGATEEQKELRNKIAHDIYLKNARTSGSRMYTARQMSVIKAYTNETMFFLWQADWRGRLYPLATTLLNPQGHDLSKGLLKFAEGAPLGISGLRQLKRAVAEHYGFDKGSMLSREEWTNTNLKQIFTVANNPIETFSWWSEADSPFQFLAACIELTAAYDWAVENDRYVAEFGSSYIKYHDGKCSGVQHWATLLRDETTAKSVGLTPATEDDVPPDLYTEVLSSLINSVSQGSTEDYAVFWKDILEAGKFDRKLTKRPTMTYVYGSTARAWASYIHEWCNEQGIEGKLQLITDNQDSRGDTAVGEEPSTPLSTDEPTYRSDLYKRCFYLAQLMEKSITVELESVVTGMKWIKKCARVLSKVTDEISWVTPEGYEVYQAYRKQKSSRVDIVCKALDLRLNLSSKRPTDKLDKVKQAGGIAPNYIHSLDSSHLVASVNMFGEADKQVTVIHDSFGALCSDAEPLLTAVKTAYVRQYSVDRLKQLKDYWEMKYKTVLPELPKSGSYDVSQVHQATYAFS